MNFIYDIGGTTRVEHLDVGEEQTIIAIQSISNLVKLIYRHNPEPTISPEFRDSLERSLDENASVWEMLSKH